MAESHVSDKRVLLSISPYFRIGVCAVCCFVGQACFFLLKKSADPEDWMYYRLFFPALFVLVTIIFIIDYSRYHVYADKNGIDIYRWGKVEHFAWDQVKYCLIQYFPLRAVLMLDCNGWKKFLHSRWNRRQKAFLSYIIDAYHIPCTESCR